MKNRKLVSLLCAASMAITSFAAMVTVQAAGETILYSDSFNGYETSEKSETGTVFAVSAGSDYSSVAGNADWQWIFNSPASQTLDKLTVGYDGSRGDDTGAILIVEKDDPADKYLQMFTNRFQSRCKPQITGFDNYTANAGEDLVIAFDLLLNDGADGTAGALDLGLGTISTATAGVTAGEWVKVKAVTSDGTTTVYVNDAEVISAAGVISTIRPQPFASDTKVDPGPYPEASIDELVILSAADGATAEIPKADDNQQEEEATPAPFDGEGVTVDFDTTDIEAAGFTSTTGGGTAVSVVDDATTGSKVWQVVQTSSKSAANQFGYAKIDISSVTEGKSHIGIEYDLLVGNSGRLSVIIANDFPSGTAADSLTSLIGQGITKSGDSGIANCKPDSWVHTTIDVDLATGLGTYKVTTLDDGSVVGQGRIETSLKSITSISLVSWSANTSSLDNLVVQAGGDLEIVATPEPDAATPEPASAVEGSYLTLTPSDATHSFDFTTVEGAAVAVENHSDAKPVQAGNVSVYDSTVNVRGKSIYALYDVYMNKGDDLQIQVKGSSDLGSTLALTANADATVSVYGLGDKGDRVNISGNLVCGTWYRVLIEVPQINNEGATNTGSAVYTIYRIDAADPTAVTEVAAQGTVTPRNLSGKGATTLTTVVTGTPYIDNSAAFIAANGFSLIEEVVETPVPVQATPEPASTVEGSYLTLTPDDAAHSFDFTAVEGALAKIDNHSDAKAVQAGDVDVYDSNVNVRGKSIYALYDVYMNKGDDLKLEVRGSSDLGSTLALTGNENGTVSVYGLGDKGDRTNISGNLVYGTWYRVLIEIPQINNEGSTNTGDAIYTIYRIDPSDPTAVKEVAAKGTVTPRNLSGKGATKLTAVVTGNPYIDNGTAFIAAGGLDILGDVWTKYVATYDANGVLTKVEVTTDYTPVEGDENPPAGTFIWNQNMKPYTAE